MGIIKINNYNNHKINETDIIRRVLAGEKELYEILIRRNNQKLYRVIRSYIKNEVDIEDIMQNTYINAYTKLYQFKLESSFATWLIRIGINESLARLKEKRKLLSMHREIDGVKDSKVIEIPDIKQLNPQDYMIKFEASQLLENAIDTLESKYKVVYVMKEIEEMSLKEIAAILDLTVTNVKVRLHRSKEKLKQKLFEISRDKEIFKFGFSRCDRITEKVMSYI